MSNIRVVVVVTQGNPELLAELEKMPARLRAERIRTLATIGLTVVPGGTSGTNKPPTPKDSKVDQQKNSLPDRATSFAKTLGGGL